MNLPVYRTVSLTTLLWLGAIGGFLFADANQINFDVNPMAPAVAIDRPDLLRTLANSRFVSIRLQLSSMIGITAQNEVDEFLFQVESRRQELQVADYFPKTEMTTSMDGNIQVVESSNQHKQANIRGAAGYPGVGWADGNASYSSQTDRQRYYAEKPVMQVLSAAGTLARRTGVYFKVKRTNQTPLEGVHEVELLFEVPNHWRGDLLEVKMEAFGRNGSRSPRSMGQSRFLVAVYMDGDEVATNVARGHVLVEQRLRQVANQFSREIKKRSQPTPFHKIGVALDVVDPEIPSQWLSDVLFGFGSQYPSGGSSKLPVDVRVAILDYIDTKEAMNTLATAGKYR